jgi:cytoskeletal protein RodZ
MAEIGATLRDARLRARIDMTEVESQTKIRAKYLRAIENEEWDLLPGPVYVKSFLRTYGDYLGLDSRMLVEEFKRRYERPHDHDMAPPIASLSRDRDRDRDRSRMPRRPSLPSWTPIAVVLVAIVAVLFVVGTVFGTSSKSSNPTGLHPNTHRHRASTPARAATTTTAAPPPQAVTLQMTPTAPLYVCLVNAHGRDLIYEQTFSPGQTIPTESGRKLLLTLGNANVQIKANGKTVPVAQSNEAIRLELTATSVQPIPMTQTPTCP